MYPSLSVADFMNYMAALKGVHEKHAVAEVLEQVEMLEFSRRKIGQLSGGMKRRVGIAQALLGKPQILVVDEPTAGLDPEERVRFRGVLSRYASEGRTVLLSTHIVEDVHQIWDELAVLRRGRLFYAGKSENLMKQVAGYLGETFSMLVNIFAPRKIVFYGEMVRIGEPFFEILRKCVKENSLKENYKGLQILGSEFGRDLGAIGAAALVMQEEFEFVEKTI